MNPRSAFHCSGPPREPIMHSDLEHKRNLKASSDDLVKALLRYGVKHGLPNIDPKDCLERLRMMPR